ncbi:MAG: 5-formyltetrahydrofolate cyclo-ligase [Propionibacteriales bacterium]|nr:5-formyltetrahydrofolate cyclo-ligase [Propionibacteriales bacterium]
MGRPSGGSSDGSSNGSSDGPSNGSSDGYSDEVSSPEPIAKAKREIRSQVLAKRARLDPETQLAAAEAIADTVASMVYDRDVATVCAYASVSSEPGTRPLLDRLHHKGVQVLLPVVLDDLDLDWARYRPGEWRPARFGLVEPTAHSLGVDAIQGAELIVCPGVAGTPAGARLGRGGGCYDRALARALPTALRCLLLYDDEVLDGVPTEPHDEPVDAVVTPNRVVSTSARRGL